MGDFIDVLLFAYDLEVEVYMCWSYDISWILNKIWYNSTHFTNGITDRTSNLSMSITELLDNNLPCTIFPQSLQQFIDIERKASTGCNL